MTINQFTAFVSSLTLSISIFIIINQTKIMTKIDELQDLVTELQNSVDTKQSAIAAAILALDDRITELQAIIDAGGGEGTGATEEQLQSVIDSLTATKTDLEATPTA